jgi:ABC-type metal ion transport system, permease component
MIWSASVETLYMVSISTLVTTLLGVPLGVVLVVTRQGHIMENSALNRILGLVVNFVRSIPFPIFIVFIIPMTRALVGTTIGPTAVIVPLTLAAIVFMARLAETAMLEVPYGVIEAALAAGANRRQVIWHVLLPEASSGLILAVTILIITLIGYSAMAGLIGGGGLGDLAVRYGYQRYRSDVMWVCVILLSLVVQAIQSFGEALARKYNRR